MFAFRRYSVEEDRRLVARTRNPGRDSYVPLNPSRTHYLADTADISRQKPYERPQKPFIAQPSNQDAPTTSRGNSPRKQVDGVALGRLFQQLAPLTKDPLNFESNAAAICASFDLDPATSTEIIGSFKQQFPVDQTQRSVCVRGLSSRDSIADVNL